MSRYSFIIGWLLLLSGVTSCISDPPCDIPAKMENVELLFVWPDTLTMPPTVYVDCYPQPEGTPIRNFLPPTGGKIFLPKGEYSLLVYSNASPKILFENMDSFSSAAAYTDGGIQPDELFCGSMTKVAIKGNGISQQFTIPMVSRVNSYYFRYSGVEGLKYVNSIKVGIDGITRAVEMASGKLLPGTFTASCNYRLLTDGFYGTLRCFGHGLAETKHTFTVNFEYGGQSKVLNYDVTQMLNKEGYIDIRDSLIFEPIGGGGIDTGVGDWEDDAVDIPIN